MIQPKCEEITGTSYLSGIMFKNYSWWYRFIKINFLYTSSKTNKYIGLIYTLGVKLINVQN